jgi:competence protein ComEC
MTNLQSVIAFFVQELSKQRKTLFLWIPVMIGVGIIAYFTHNLILPLSLLLIIWGICVLGVGLGWRLYAASGKLLWLTVLLFSSLFALVLTGYGLAYYRDSTNDTRVLENDLPVTNIVGEIEKIVPLEGGKAKRVVLNNIQFADERFQEWNGIRVRLRSFHFDGEEWGVGDIVDVRAKLRAPGLPVIPDGFDFRQKAYFEGLSAVGYTLADASMVVNSDAESVQIEDIRQKIGAQLYQLMAPPNAGIASALLTGERGGILKEDTEALRTAGLAHLLAISGLHIGLVAGCVFFFVRLFLVLIPGFALRYPAKKWAAACAILVAFSYMVLAGATVPTIRAFIMTALVLFAVILDRSAINMRLVALAAIIVMVMTPEVIMGPSFVLSFSAVAGLIVFYQSYGRKWLVNGNAYHPVWRPIYYLFGVILTTVIATLATAPFSILFFNRMAVYSVLSNILAMPLMSFLVMPFGLFATLLMPLGLDGWAWPIMEWGIAQIVIISHAIADYKGANLYWPSFDILETFLICFGFLFLLLWQGAFRFIGLVFILFGFTISLGLPQKQIMISEKMNAIMIVDKSEDKYYLIGKLDRYTRKNWLNALGKDHLVDTHNLQSGDKLSERMGYCDDFQCRLSIGGYSTHIVRNALSVHEACAIADILIADFPIDDEECVKPVEIIDRFDVWRNGATTILFDDDAYTIKTVKGGDN